MTDTPITAFPCDGRDDPREQLYNAREVGPFRSVQRGADQIAILWGYFFDLDLGLFRPGPLCPGLEAGPGGFFEQTVRPWLARHPVLAEAEVRCSGTGLHVITWLEEPVEFDTDGRRRRWDGMVRAIQALLPVDPHQPGIAGLTRPVGSVNSKNGSTVVRLKDGTPVAAERVERLFEQMHKSPFMTVMSVLLGGERVRPCPACGAEGTTLVAGDYLGHCYGACGKVGLDDLYNVFLAPQPSGSKGAGKS